MGLDTSHDCWHGAYHVFARWRLAVAEAAGYKLAKYADAGTMYPLDDHEHYAYPRPVIPWELYEERNYYGEWDRIPEDPLLLLLVHSDAEGVIKADHAGWLADRLEELAPQMTDENGPHLRIGSYRAWTERFAAGLRRAADAGEDVDFH